MPSDDRARSMTNEELRKIRQNGAILAASSIVFMGILTLLVHYDGVKLYPSTMTEEILKGFAARVEYALRYQTLLAFYLLFNIMATIFGRLTRGALNPLDEKTETRVQREKNILTNSFESIVLSVFSQLIFVSFAAPGCILKCIPLINVLHFVGRIAFHIGYPLKRSFGYSATIIPTTVLNFYNLYKFVSFLGLY